MANIILDATKSTGVSSTVTLNAGEQINLVGFELSQAEQVFVNESGQLIIVLNDGTQFLVNNFGQNLAEDPTSVAIVSESGEPVSYSDVIASFTTNAQTEQEIEPALGPTETVAAVPLANTATISEGSNAAENSDLFGAGFGLGEVVTSEAPEAEAEAQNTVTTQASSAPVSVIVGPNSNNGSVTGIEDSIFTLNIQAPTDVDSDDSALSMTITALPDAAAGQILLAGSPITVGQVLTPTELTSLVFAATADFNGTATLGYNITDPTNQTTASTHVITVTGVQDSPVFTAPSSLTVDEDSTATNLNLNIPTDADTPYGDVLTVTLTTPLASIDGTITLDNVAITDGQTFTTAELGRLQFTPDANYNGSFTINYSVEDSDGNTATNSHTVTVNPINDAPVLTGSTSTQIEDTSASLGIPTPTDIEGDIPLIANIAVLPTEGTLYLADGVTPVLTTDNLSVAQLTGLVFIPNTDFSGTVTINYTVNDGADTSSATHTITVTPVNDLPVANDSTSSQDEDTVDGALNIPAPIDVDDAVLTARIDTLPTDGTLNFANGTAVSSGVEFDVAELSGLTFTPNADFAGTVVINYTVSDDEGASDTAAHTITVNPINDAPTLTDSTSTQDEDTTAGLGIPTPTDVEGDIPLIANIAVLPTEGTIYLADGVTPVLTTDNLSVAQLTGLVFVPNADFSGTVTINYTVNDGTDTASATHTITVNPVNDSPVIAGDTTSTQDEDTVDGALNIPTPTDVDDATLSARIDILPTAGILNFADGTAVSAGVEFDATELAGLTFTPNADVSGDVSFTYIVLDDEGASDSATHTITVNPINDAPVVTDSTSSQDEDSGLTDLNIPAPTDIEGDTLTINITALPTDGTLYYADGSAVGALDNLTVADLTSLRFAPNADFNGTVAISYTVDDGTDTVSATHTVTVSSIEDSPIVSDSTSTQDEDTETALGIPVPTDGDNDTLYAEITTLPTDGILKFADGSLVPAATQFLATELSGITFTPNTNYLGTVVINYTVTDNNTAPVAATHTITVNNTPDEPVVVDSSSNQDEDVMADLGIPTPTDPDGDALSVVTVTPTNGTLYQADGITIVNAGDSLTIAELTTLKFLPNADFNGTATITYTVSDSDPATADVTGTHTVTVNPINDAPVAAPDSTSTQVEDSTDIGLGIIAPTDVDTGDALQFRITNLPSGTIKLADGTEVVVGTLYDIAEITGLTFSPAADFNGDVIISYDVSDGTALDSATHTVTVTPVNDAPDVITPTSSTQDEDTAATIAITVPSDVDGDSLTATIAVLPTEGTLTLADGSPISAGVAFDSTELPGLVFTPNANYNGTVVIDYTVTDGTDIVAGQHTITVTQVNDLPVVTNSSSTQAEDTADVVLGIPLATDVDGDALTFTIDILPTEGTFSFTDGSAVVEGTAYAIAEIANIRFTPNADFNGTVTLDYTVSDGIGAVQPATHTITVTPVNDLPDVLTPTSSTQDEDTSAALGLPVPTDVDADSLTSIVTLPTEGTLTFADGSAVSAGVAFNVSELAGLVFTPNTDFNGTVVIDYTVTDGTGTVAGQHTVTVNPVNDLPVVTDSTSTQAEDTTDVVLNIPLATDVDGDVLNFTVNILPTEGTLTFADGSALVAGTSYPIADIATVRFTPNADFNGTVEIDYSVSDGVGAAQSATHTVTVTPVNDAPVANDSTSSQDEDTVGALGIPVATDVDGDSLTATIAILPTDGTLRFSDGTNVSAGIAFDVAELPNLEFTPNANFNGTVTIDYSVTDGTFTDTATHTVTVNPVNDLPTVVANSTSSQGEDTADVTLSIPVATDIDGDVLRFELLALPTDGTLTFADGSALAAGVSYPIADIATVRFTPNADFNGDVIINYIVSDGVGADVPGSHTITVTPVNDAPVANDSTSSQNEDTAATLAIPTPSDVDGDSLTATITTLPTEGTLTFADGSAVSAGVAFSADELSGLIFTPNLNFFGTVTLNYTVSDGALIDTAIHTITVNEMADGISVSADPLEDNGNQIDFSSLLRVAEMQDCVTTGSYSIDAEYQYNTVLAGSSYNYALPSGTFTSLDGSTLTYSATYTYNGTTYTIPTSGNWVTIDSSTGQLSGSFPSSMVGLVTFNFTASASGTVSDAKSITYNIMSQSQYNSLNVIGPRYGDYLLPYDGKDNLMVGMGNNDILRYDLSQTGKGIYADLDKGYVDKNNGYTDLVDGFKEIQATNYGDTIIAEDGAKTYVFANAGNDTVVSSSSADYLNGGSGTDTLSYENATSAVNVNLSSGSSSVGDTIVSFENLTGSANNDSLVGSSAANIIDGGEGADAVYGQAGNDTIIYDANDTTISGGSGYDALIITDANSSTGNDIDLSKVAGGTATISGFEEINMDNTSYLETLHMNVGELLASSEGKEIRIKGDLVMDLEGAPRDDMVQLHDKTSSQISNAESGTTTIDGTRYDIYDFGSEGRLLVEFGLDVLDSSGNVVY